MKIQTKYLFFIIIVLSLSIQSCSLLQPNKMFKTEKGFEYNKFEPQEEKEYRIQPYDIISLSINTNDGYKLINTGEMQRNSQNLKQEIEYLVEYDGYVKIPVLGRIKLTDLTIREAEKLLEEKYKEYYNNPFIFLKVNNRKVYIFKSGGEQGSVINIPEDRLTLIEALAISGGIPDGDKAYKIKLIRGDVSKDPQVYKYNVSSLEQLQGTNLLLQANDIIYIDTRPRYARRLLVEMTPYLTLLTTALLLYNLF
jgi:polysaccharide export outer membrane protein